jgi:type IV pilus assembly protein PilV
MSSSKLFSAPRGQRGATLIEILVSLVILMLGLLGLIGVMVQSQRAQLESYQRTQAMLLVQDMAARINANRVAADCYAVADTLGTGYGGTPDASACAVGSTPQKDRVTADLVAWNAQLKGAGETMDVSGTATQIGGILGARGCITKNAATGVFQVSVAWQSVESGGAPPAGISCGSGSYGGESFRRAVSITVLPVTAT